MAYYREADFTPCRSIGYLLKRAYKTALGLIEARFRDQDLSFSQWVALALVEAGIADTTAGIARDLGHDSGATTRLVDSLQERGLIQRNRDPNDRRIARLTVTPDGDRVRTDCTPRLMNFWNEALSGFSRDEVDQVASFLERLTRRLDEMAKDEAGK
jgi:DNA-binding MarR family transcriptional regulator